eukprot:tig00020537_g10249.t1
MQEVRGGCTPTSFASKKDMAFVAAVPVVASTGSFTTPSVHTFAGRKQFASFTGLRRTPALFKYDQTAASLMDSVRSAQAAGTSFTTVASAKATTSVKRNANMAKLAAGYLFPEIARRRNDLLKRRPDAKIISLGIGDTTQPIVPHIVEGLKNASIGLGTPKGYSGYGPEQGIAALREAIAKKFYPGIVDASEIFVSDGSKCDIARLQLCFGGDVSVAVQDPSYPVYVDTSVMMGMTGGFDQERSQYNNIVYMTCKPENNFFPDLASLPRTDIVFFCSPNNPTGAVATKAQLKELVDFCRKNGSILVFDAAYSAYVKDPSLATSIYEIEGAREVAIETNSFSKVAGFTGVRLGWTVVPESLTYADGTPVRNDFNRVMGTCFNGASNVAQAGGLACLEEKGYAQIQEQVDYYMENAAILRKTFTELGFQVYGGANAPYVWVNFPGRKSWDVFTDLLENAEVVCTPGSGFGPAGEGFLRFSAFCGRENLLEAIERIKKFVAKA